MAFFANKNVWIAGGVLVVMILVASVFFFHASEQTVVLAWVDVVEELNVSGKVVSADAIRLGFPFEGKVTDIYAKEGKEVAQGDPLFHLDITEADSELKQLDAKAGLEKLKLSQLLAGISRKETSLFESKAEEARVALQNARKESEDAKLTFENKLEERYARAADYGDTALLNADNAIKALEVVYDEHNAFRAVFLIPESSQKSEAEWQMRFAKTALENIMFDAGKLKTNHMHEDTDLAISRFKTNLEVIRSSLQKTAEILDDAHTAFGAPDIGGYRTTVAVQRAVINTTQTALLTLEQDIASEKVKGRVQSNDAERKIVQLEASLETAEKELALKRAVSPEAEAALAQAQVREYESRLSVLRDRIRQATVLAPAKGIILRVYVRDGATGKAGDLVVSLSPFSSVQIEIDAKNVAISPKAGDRATVLFGKDLAFQGSVGGVSDEKIIVYLQEEAEASRLPEYVSVVIRTVIREHALMVPEEFIFEEDGVKKVYVRENATKKSVAILTGITWKNNVEILEGVSEGDRIIK
ncbi:biotin/lipoyl-binding protein [Candidatus Azambacteria bacterium]|nr:biotin/lipoyl-binding protein [Candidatus Azambacteria bacterium]MBI3684939.1 biotin/lipoyl-binding protein [Candidatus Azambacteria bacterium]